MSKLTKGLYKSVTKAPAKIRPDQQYAHKLIIISKIQDIYTTAVID